MPRPVRRDETGTALVTGFSPNMLKLFVSAGELGLEDAVEALDIADGEDGAVQVTRKVRSGISGRSSGIWGYC